VAFSAGLVLSACSKPPPKIPDIEKSVPEIESKNVVEAAPYPAPEMSPSSADSLSFQLLRKYAAQKENVVVSPYSLRAALAMTSLGAKGDTLKELEDKLELKSGDKKHIEAKRLHDALTRSERKTTLTSVNKIYLDKSMNLIESAEKNAREYYDAGLASADFRNTPDAERLKINDWVSKQTRERIENLLPEGTVKASTKMILVNALYFFGEWKKPFKKEESSARAFYGKRKARVMTMHKHFNSLGYEKRKHAEFICLDYIDDDLGMYVALPNKGSSLNTMLKTITPALLNDLRAAMLYQEVEVYLPRFRIEETMSFDEDLKRFGIKKAFSTEADFTGFAGKDNPLLISSVIQKAFIEVNEKGTEAAAATALLMVAGGMPQKPPTFDANRPFAFWVEHKHSHTILFAGAVQNHAALEKP